MKKELFESAEAILTNYNNVPLKRKLKKEENHLYHKMSLEELKHEILQIKELEKINNIYNAENYELAIANNIEKLLIRRVDSKLFHELVFRESLDYIPLFSEDNKLVMVKNMETSNANLNEKLSKNIDAKFLYLLSMEDRISQEDKNKIFARIKYLTTTIEDDLLANKKLQNIINEENDYYENEGSKLDIYNELVMAYIKNIINHLFNKVIKTENGLNKVVNEVYLRSLLVYLDNEILDKMTININGENGIQNLIIKKYFDSLIDGVQIDKKILKIKR